MALFSRVVGGTDRDPATVALLSGDVRPIVWIEVFAGFCGLGLFSMVSLGCGVVLWWKQRGAQPATHYASGRSLMITALLSWFGLILTEVAGFPGVVPRDEGKGRQSSTRSTSEASTAKQPDWLGQYIKQSEQLLQRNIDYGEFAETALRQNDAALVEMARSQSRLRDEAEIIANASVFAGERLRASSELQARAKTAFVEGPFDPSQPSLDNLETQLDLARQWYLTNRHKRKVLDSSAHTFASVIQGRVSSSAAQAAIDGYTDGLQPSLLQEMNDEDARAAQAMIEYFSLLRKEWGRWRLDLGTGEIVFDADFNGELADRARSSWLVLEKSSSRIDQLLSEYLLNAKKFGSEGRP